MTTQKTIGAIFTPLKWGQVFVRKFHIAEQWLNGATLFDPTMGNGQLLEAVITEALHNGCDKNKLPLNRLFGCEINRPFYQQTFKRFKQKYNLTLPKNNFFCCDFFSLPKKSEFDIILANPPWSNFTDLPESYKVFIKEKFLDYGLVHDKRKLLWGGSRIDIAALVIQKSVTEHLKLGGQGYFFTPLSLLLNDGAHAGFRHYKAGDENFCIEALYDFADTKIFPDVNTRYGFIALRKGQKMKFPVKCWRREGGKWLSYYGHCDKRHENSAWILSLKRDFTIQPIAVNKDNRPRQGVNSCGANDIYFFDSLQKIGNGKQENVLVSNKTQEAILPKRYIYPLMVADNFHLSDETVRRWVFLPYEKSGKVLSLSQVQADEVLSCYLYRHEVRLRNRRGVMIGSFIRRGLWWGLLGVGAYNFARYRIAWEAYGRDYFAPRLFGESWQANQSLQAFMPFDDLRDAKKTLDELNDGRMQNYLLGHAMGGTMGWAQPGRVKKFLVME